MIKNFYTRQIIPPAQFIGSAIALFFLMFLCGAFFVSAADKSGESTEQQKNISVAFETPNAIVDLVAILDKQKYDFVVLQSSFIIDGREINDFILIPKSNDLDQAIAGFLNSRASVQLVLKEDDFIRNEHFLTGSKNDLMIKSMDIVGRDVNFSALVEEFPKDRVKLNSHVKPSLKKVDSYKEVKPVTNNDAITSLATANTPYYTLIPSSGSITSGTFTSTTITNPTRGVVNYMKWSSNGFTSDQTYEHDFFLLKDSNSPGTYFARSFTLTPWCQPKTVYAATSWPSSAHPFIDSDLESNGLCSSSGYIAYSLGAAQANAITTNVDHFTAILMPNGDADTDKFLLQGQVGYQYPVGSHSALNSYPYGYGVSETTHYGLIKNGNVPGSQSWTFSGNVPDTPTNISAIEPTSSSIKIKFTDITWDETSIIIERSKGGSSGPWTAYNFGVLNNGNTVGKWSWTNTGLSAKSKYCYRAKATNQKGSSPYSSIVCSTTL